MSYLTESEAKLPACPICGGVYHIARVRENSGGNRFWYARCRKCWMKTGNYATIDDVVEVLNYREGARNAIPEIQ
jgi:hypothetical protein